MKSLLKLHTLTLLGLAFAANFGLQVYLATGQIKTWAEINWMDVAGEGGSAGLALVWLIMLLHSRPAGRVTRLLALGLACPRSAVSAVARQRARGSPRGCPRGEPP